MSDRILIPVFSISQNTRVFTKVVPLSVVCHHSSDKYRTNFRNEYGLETAYSPPHHTVSKQLRQLDGFRYYPSATPTYIKWSERDLVVGLGYAHASLPSSNDPL